jgi:hypothetical protein
MKKTKSTPASPREGRKAVGTLPSATSRPVIEESTPPNEEGLTYDRNSGLLLGSQKIFLCGCFVWPIHPEGDLIIFWPNSFVYVSLASFPRSNFRFDNWSMVGSGSPSSLGGSLALLYIACRSVSVCL